MRHNPVGIPVLPATRRAKREGGEDVKNRLERDLGALFSPSPARVARKDLYRKTRELARKLAAEHGIEIEKFREGGMNIWPPAGIDAKEDPYDEDHYVSDWDEALQVVEAYVKLLSARTG